MSCVFFWLVGWLEVMKFMTEKRNVFFWGGRWGRWQMSCHSSIGTFTLLETNSEFTPENGWLE